MMPQERLKALKTEDFMAPNRVLCYGGGGAFGGVAPYLLVCGFNISGIIDANKRGSIEVCGKELPFFTIEQVKANFGRDVRIIITIANENIIRQVEETLIHNGFDADKIFDLNVWTWLTVPSEKSHCPNLGGYLQFMQAALSTCCNIGSVQAYLSEWLVEGRPVEQSIENFLAKRAYYLEESKKGNVPLYCKNCHFLSGDAAQSKEQIARFIISDHAYCNADCVYCSDACSIPHKHTGHTVEERYSGIIQALRLLQKRDLLAEHAIFQIAGGEITINPHKQRLYDTVRSSPNLEVQFLSNGFLYDPEIANSISINSRSFVQCDLDAGTPETYIKVKGFNKFYTVVENLKRYAQHGTVKVKYVILSGWNDTDADYEGTVALLKVLGLRQLTLSPEFNDSRENDRKKGREIAFAAARFMVLLEENGIEVALPSDFWQQEHIASTKRLCRELQELRRMECAKESGYEKLQEDIGR